MGLFQWIGKLLDDLVDWLGKAAKAFLDGLMWGLQKIWETTVAAILYAAFAGAVILYAIFYAGASLGETIMEVWDPRYVDNKPSERIKIKQAPQSSPLPKYRNEAKVVTLENWN